MRNSARLRLSGPHRYVRQTRSPRQDIPARWSAIIWVGLLFAVTLLFFGGSSRPDTLAQMAVRLAAIMAIAGSFALSGSRIGIAPYRLGYSYLAVVILLMAAQLFPLPPSLWTTLPGRDLYAQAAIVAGIPQPWRPINLTPDLGWDALLGTLIPIATLVILSGLRRSHLPGVVGLIMVAAGASALLGLLQMAQGPDGWLYYYPISSIGTPTGFLANRNHQAVLLAIGIPAAALWAGSGGKDHAGASDRMRLYIAIGISLLLLIVLIGTGSRAGLLVGLVGSLAAAYFWSTALAEFLQRAASRLRRLFYLAFIAGMSAVGLLVYFIGRASSVQRLFAMGFEDDVRGTSLTPIWTMLTTFFPFGSGYGSFDRVYRRFERVEDLRMNYMNQAHNDYLQTGIEGGVFGLALLLAYAGWWLWRAFALWRPAKVGEPDNLGRFGVIVTGIIMLSSAADYPIRAPLIAAIFVFSSVVMTGTLLGRYSRANPPTGGRTTE